MEAFIRDEKGNELETFTSLDIDKLRDWFERTFKELNGRIPSEDEVLRFFYGEYVFDDDYEKDWFCVWGAEDGPIDFDDLEDWQKDCLRKQIQRDSATSEEDAGDFEVSDDEIILTYGMRFDPDDFRR